ncbi:MAG: SPOR domain-containing protein [Thiotrichaceae bacterium]|nr:SPOR domain-containing protein [Thiotrichaceae bacterium]
MAQNVRRPVTVSESYDPKQRAIGGVVLTLIMLLVYFFLQALVTLSIPSGVVRSSTGEYVYVLAPIKDDEKTSEEVEDVNGDVYIPELPRSISQFVFLDIDGTPFGTDNKESFDENLVTTLPIIGTYWIVQAASFKKHSRAENMLTELETEGLDMEIKKIGSWYTVRTVPQRTEADAESMKKQLQPFGIKGLIKKIE